MKLSKNMSTALNKFDNSVSYIPEDSCVSAGIKHSNFDETVDLQLT